jgi:hypothetical protein
MTRPVPLIRRFTPISRPYQDQDVELDQAWSFLERGERRDWGQLRDEYRVVVLADAGAGKTYELQAEAKRLAGHDKPAFFIRIEDIGENFGDAFEVGTSEAFERWLAGTDDAWFFLDSVDEVRLEAPRAFETALSAFASRIHDARHRAHVIISSRPYAWRSKLDRELIDKLLPYERPRLEQAGRAEALEPDEAVPIIEPAETTGLSLYRLAPLDRDDILIFAGHRGVADTTTFLDALDRGALLGLAQLPFDLEDIIAIWQETHSLDGRLAVLERGILRRLAPPPEQPSSLPVDRALDGARRLALAATLTGDTNIQIPGGAGPGLDAAGLLDDWSEGELAQLLARGVFSDAIYGMVRFRHRETRELLAARCLSTALGDEATRHAVEAVVFRTVYGEPVVVPRLRPVLPWLILFDDRIRDRALALLPGIATEGGDPARLPYPIRRQILHGIMEGIVRRDARGGDNSEIARIAQPDLSADVLALVDAHGEDDEAIFFLGRLAWQGMMREPAERLESIARDPGRGIYARRVSARAVCMVLGGDNADALWTKLNKSGERLPRRLLAELVDAAPGRIRFVEILLESLGNLEPYERFNASGLSQSIHGFIDRLPLVSERAPEQALACLVKGLAGFLAREPHVERRECRVSKEYSWLMAPAMHAIERLIVGRSRASLGSAALAVLNQLPALREWEGQDPEYKSRLGELVPRWLELNDALFWHCVATARAARKAEDAPLIDDCDVSWMGHLWSFDAASFQRTAAWITGRDLPDDRSVALSRSFRTYAQNGRPRAWRRELWRAVEGTPMLEAKLRTLMHPPPSPDRKRWRANDRKWKIRQQRREENKSRWRTEFVARLKADPDLIRAPSKLEPGEMSWDQAHLLQSIEGDRLRTSRHAGSKWRTLIPEFGLAVAEAFRDGARRHWRAYRPTLRSENSGSATIPYALIFAMAGLEIEAGDDGLGVATLGREEVALALRYVPHELNGFPTWFEPLYRAHTDASQALVWGETRWELANSQADQPLHYMLHDLVYHAPWLHKDLAAPICDWLQVHGAANADCLRYGRTIMVSGGLDAARLGTLAKTRIEDAATPPAQLPNWFALWVDVAPDVAIPALEAILAGLARPEDARFAEQFAVALVGGRREGGPSIGAWRTKRHQVVAADLLLAILVTLHPGGRNAPERLLAVQVLKLGPACAMQFIRPDGCQREETKRQARDRPCMILFGRNDHLPELLEIGDGRLTTLAKRLQDGAELLGWVIPASPFGNGVGEDGRDALADALGGLNRPACLDLAQDRGRPAGSTGRSATRRSMGTRPAQDCAGRRWHAPSPIAALHSRAIAVPRVRTSAARPRSRLRP